MLRTPYFDVINILGSVKRKEGIADLTSPAWLAKRTSSPLLLLIAVGMDMTVIFVV